MDVLSDLLRAVRLTGAVYFDIRARAPWVAESPAAASVGGRVMPGFEQVVFFHIVLDGQCWAALADDPASAIRLGPGEAVVVPGGDRHVMSSAPGMRAEPAMGIYRHPEREALPYVFADFGGGGAPTRYACGFLGYDRPFNPVLAALPRMMHVSAAGPGSGLIADVARAALTETERPGPGVETFLGKLGELVFVQAIRQHLAAMPADATGWFAGLRDRHVGQALALMHGDPAARWTLEELAQRGRPVALVLRRALRRGRRDAADAVSRHLAAAARGAADREPGAEHRAGGGGGRLRLRGGVQPGVQEAGRGAARRVAAGAARPGGLSRPKARLHSPRKAARGGAEFRRSVMGYRVAVVGATGNVGREMLNILAEREFPVDEIVALASRKSLGSECSFGERTLKTLDLDGFDFAGWDIALFAIGSDATKKYAPIAAKAGCVVIDNSSLYRYDPAVPLIVPEVNPDAIEGYAAKNIIANPNCSTAQMVVALKPLHDRARVRRVVVATYQSVSGSGKEAMDELWSQTKGIYVPGQEVAPHVYPKQIAFNVIPQIDTFMEDGSTREEWKMVAETKKIVDASIKVVATCVRVPVFVGHSEAINVEFEDFLDEEEARDILREAPGVLVVDKREDGGYVTPVECVGEYATYVSRIRQDSTIDNGLSMWVVSDNLRKGAALNAVQIAELLGRRVLKKG